jgi:hypothetical protein
MITMFGFVIAGSGLIAAMVALLAIASRRQRKFIASLALGLLPLALWVWPGVLIRGVHHSVDIPGYRVALVERTDLFFFDVPRYFEIERQVDGAQARFQLDIDASRCIAPQTVPQGDRLYVQCAGEVLDQASYVDQAKLTVFSGWYQEEVAIDSLEFISPVAPSLAGSLGDDSAGEAAS